MKVMSQTLLKCANTEGDRNVIMGVDQLILRRYLRGLT